MHPQTLAGQLSIALWPSTIHNRFNGYGVSGPQTRRRTGDAGSRTIPTIKTSAVPTEVRSLLRLKPLGTSRNVPHLRIDYDLIMKKRCGPILEFSLSPRADGRITFSPIEKHRSRLVTKVQQLEKWRAKFRAFADAQAPTSRFPPGKETGQLALPFDSSNFES